MKKCRECGDYCEELYQGWCGRCLAGTINLETFLEYCEQERYLEQFVMCEMLYCEEYPRYPSDDFHELMVKVYKERVNDFLDDCIDYIMNHYGNIGRENYADWINNLTREAK